MKFWDTQGFLYLGSFVGGFLFGYMREWFMLFFWIVLCICIIYFESYMKERENETRKRN